jgi:uncharacterized protein (TIGR00297 family)
MTLPPTQLAIGLGLAVTIAAFSLLFRLLTTSGAFAAGLLGFVIFGGGGWAYGVPLIAFFLSSSLLSRIGKTRKAAQRVHNDKSSTRDAGQVLANGSIAGILVIIQALDVTVAPPRNVMLLYLAALAAVNADTWATEIGGLWRGRPLLVTTLRRVEPGISGAVSPVGLLAALAGAVFIVGTGWLVWPKESPLLLWRPDAAELLAIVWAAFVAAFGDSVLGASVQAQYKCAACGTLTESRFHCGGPAILSRGHRRITNDAVNFLTSLMGVIFAAILLSTFANPR